MAEGPMWSGPLTLVTALLFLSAPATRALLVSLANTPPQCRCFYSSLSVKYSFPRFLASSFPLFLPKCHLLWQASPWALQNSFPAPLPNCPLALPIALSLLYFFSLVMSLGDVLCICLFSVSVSALKWEDAHASWEQGVPLFCLCYVPSLLHGAWYWCIPNRYLLNNWILFLIFPSNPLTSHEYSKGGGSDYISYCLFLSSILLPLRSLL